MTHPALATILDPDIIYSLVIDGDIGQLNNEQRVAYYAYRCNLLGIDPGEQPFEVLNLSGKTRMYLTKAGANALTRVNELSVEIKSLNYEGSLVIVEARAVATDGRFADDVGIVDLDDPKERKLGKANGTMKAVTKAKRRAVIALVGLGVLDLETETDTLVQERRAPEPTQRRALAAAPSVDPGALDASDPLGPRCAGKAGGIAKAIAERTAELAAIMAKTDAAIYRGAISRVGLDVSKYPRPPLPHELTVDDGTKLSTFLKSSLERHTREPGDDDDPDFEDERGRDMGEKLPLHSERDAGLDEAAP